LKTIGHNLKNLNLSQKAFRHPCCPKLVTSLIGYSLKIWTPIRKLFAPPGVITWLRAWTKPSDGMAFLTYNRDGTIDPERVSYELSKRNADWILSFNCARRCFV